MNQDQLPRAIQTWLDTAVADVTQRGLPELAPMLQTLARATAALRRGSWNDDASDGGAAR